MFVYGRWYNGANMPRFIKYLQMLIAGIIAAFIGYDFVSTGIVIFQQTYVILIVALTLMLELALWVIIKLIEDD